MSGQLASQYGPHVKGIDALDDVDIVELDAMAAVRLRMLEAVRDRSLMLITGPCGCGKSFATARAAEACLARWPDVHLVWLEVSSSLRGRALLIDLYPQILGVEPTASAPMRSLRNDIARALAERTHLLVLDETQHVTPEAMHLLRWFHDRIDTQAALVIVGTPELARKLPPELQSRVVSNVGVTRMADEDTPGILAAYHPLFRDVDPVLLAHLNRTQAFGEFRWWANFLLRAQRYLPRLGGDLTADAAQAICNDLGTGSRR